MSEFVIFETEHTKQNPRILYSSDGNVSDRAIEECHNWFDDRRARVVFDKQRPVIESFVALRTNRGKRSAYVRYEAERGGELFAPFRKKVSQTIEEEGWELLEQDPSPRDDTWLFEQIMHGNLEELSLHDLEFDDPEDAQVLDTLLDNDHHAVVAVRTYRHAMNAILAFVGEGRSIVIYHRKPSGRSTVAADLDLIVQPNKSQPYVLSTETREAVEQYKNREERHIEDLQAAIRGLAEHDVNPRRVFEKVDDELDESYPHNISRFGAYLQCGLRGISNSPGSREDHREKINTYLGQYFSEFQIPSPEAWKQQKSKSGSSSRRLGSKASVSRTGTNKSQRGGTTGPRTRNTGSDLYASQGSLSKGFNRTGRSRKRLLVLFFLAVACLFFIVALFVIGPFGIPNLFDGNGAEFFVSGGTPGT